MIEVFVDGRSIDPREFQMLSQVSPSPGGSRYNLRIDDEEIVPIVIGDLKITETRGLTRAETVLLFNLLRPYISLKLGRLTPQFWANTVDSICTNGTALECGGICSPRVKSD